MTDSSISPLARLLLTMPSRSLAGCPVINIWVAPLRPQRSSPRGPERLHPVGDSGTIVCASTAQITSGGRTHPRRLLVELGSLRAPEPGNRPGRSHAIKPTYGG